MAVRRHRLVRLADDLDFDQIPVEHKAHKQALADLLTVLKTQAPVVGVTQAQIDKAQDEVSKNMDW